MAIRYDRLLDCITALEASPDPSKFNMDVFYDHNRMSPCCIIGHYHWMFLERYIQDGTHIHKLGGGLFASAADHFGIDSSQRDYLFGGYREEDGVHNHEKKPTTIEEAVEYIHDFINKRGEIGA